MYGFDIYIYFFSFDRSELLDMVKKNSKLLGKTVIEEQESLDVEMDQRFWHDVLDYYFFRCKESMRKQDDDLVFFVKKLVRILLSRWSYFV